MLMTIRPQSHVYFHYLTPKDGGTFRHGIVQKVYISKNLKRMLTMWDGSVGDYRTFHMDRIKLGTLTVLNIPKG